MTSTRSEVKHPSWTRAQIRSARQIPLKPVLERLGYRLLPRPGGNWHIEGLCPDILVKDHYWLCPDTGQAGNAIDLLLRIRHMSFNQAMEHLTRPAAS